MTKQTIILDEWGRQPVSRRVYRKLMKHVKTLMKADRVVLFTTPPKV